MKTAVYALFLVLLAGYAYSQSIIAVDPGSTYMKTVLIQPGKAFDIALTPDSRRKTFSGISILNGVRSFGSESFNVYGKKPLHAVWRLRDMVGRSPSDPELLHMLKRHHLDHQKLVEAEDGTGALRIEFAPNTKDAQVFSAEELFAMVLRHCKENAEREGETKVSALTLTTPNFFSTFQRQGLLDAVEISSMNLLSLVDENGAAAIQYAIDRSFNNTIHMLIFNLGGTSLEVSVVEISGGKRGTKEFRQIRVLAKAWDALLGAEELDLILASKFAKEFDLKHSKTGDDKIANSLRALVRLKKEGRAIKEILSGLDKYPANFQSLHRDLDFSSLVLRKDFEAAAENFLARISAPIKRVLAASGNVKLDFVQMVGGGFRVPSVRRALSQSLPNPEMELSTHVNSDEGMAFGAAFVAANLSSSFHVPRLVYFSDCLPREIRLVVESADDKKNVTLFPRFTLVDVKDTKQVIKFTHTSDFTVKLFEVRSEEDDGDAAHELIREYKVQGFTDAKQNFGKFGDAKVHLTFSLDRNMMSALSNAVAEFKEEYVVEEVKNKSVSNDTESVTKVRKHHFALTVLDVDAHLRVKKMTTESKTKSQERIAKWEAEELTKFKLEEARNNLEAFGFVSKEKLRQAKVETVIAPAELEALHEELSRIEDWIDDQGKLAPEAVFVQERLRLQTKVDRVFHLLKEHNERPAAHKAVIDLLRAVEGRRSNWTVERPWVPPETWQKLDTWVERSYDFLAQMKAKQAALTPFDEPVFTLSMIHTEMERIQKLVESVLRMRKPAVVVPPKATTNFTKDANETTPPPTSDEL